MFSEIYAIEWSLLLFLVGANALHFYNVCHCWFYMTFFLVLWEKVPCIGVRLLSSMNSVELQVWLVKLVSAYHFNGVFLPIELQFLSFYGAFHHLSFSFWCKPYRLQAPCGMSIGSTRCFSEDVTHMPDFKDPNVLNAFKDLMAASWDEIPDNVLHDVKEALSGNTDDKAGQEVLANVYRAAEAVEEFTGVLTSLKMELDDSIGLSGEVKSSS